MTNTAARPHIAIIGAGAAGLAAAEVLSRYSVSVSVYEQMPTAARKILMAGKTGLNISHSEPLPDFISRYTPSARIAPFITDFSAKDIQAWMAGLGIESFIGSTGRIFPKQMKASGLVRAWLRRLSEHGVTLHYRHRLVGFERNGGGLQLNLIKKDADGNTLSEFSQHCDALILACGGGSYARLGSDGAWQAWFSADKLTPLYASNVGVVRAWSSYAGSHFGQAIKGVRAWVDDERAHSHTGDIIMSHYGLESGLIYKLNREMRRHADADGAFTLYLDLLPAKNSDEIQSIFNKNAKKSLNTILKKLGLDNTKITLLRECTLKTDWSDANKMSAHIKALAVRCSGFRAIDEAISTGGGVRMDAIDACLALKDNPGVFIAGEMLDWDAPTGGYLLTACLAMGRAAGASAAAFVGYDDNKYS